jgi:heme/copper-type cytochrome/quinol oxidase subunit 2
VPSLGVKLDACPGRLNEVFIFLKRTGLFFGQCSEICGVNHAFMPICVKSVHIDHLDFFLKDIYLKSAGSKLDACMAESIWERLDVKEIEY